MKGPVARRRLKGIALFLIGVMVPVPARGEPFVLRLATVAPQHFSYGKVLLECVKEIGENTKGRVKILP